MRIKTKRILFRSLHFVFIVLTVAIAFVGVVFLSVTISYRSTYVYGRSMLPTINQHVKTNNEQGDMVLVSNMRHYTALKDAYNALLRANVALGEKVPTDLVAQDIREALYSIGTIVGEVTTDEVLDNIFRNFCIGK